MTIHVYMCMYTCMCLCFVCVVTSLLVANPYYIHVHVLLCVCVCMYVCRTVMDMTNYESQIMTHDFHMQSWLLKSWVCTVLEIQCSDVMYCRDPGFL